MKKLILGLLGLMLLPAGARAITYQSVRASTANVVTPSIQTGTMNLSSGTVTNLNSTNMGAQFLTVGSSASIPIFTASTMTVTNAFTAQSSSTLQNVTATTSTFTGPMTVKSSMTVTGNGEVDGVFKATGTVTLGSAGNTVTISSNVVMPGTTIYAGGTYSIVSDSMNLTGVFKVQNSSTNSCGYVIGSIVKTQQFTAATASTGTTSSYQSTSLSGSYTPLCASDKLIVEAAGSYGNANASSTDTDATIFAGSTDLSASATNGLCGFGDGGITAQVEVPCYMKAFYSPGSTSAITFVVKVRNAAGVSQFTWGKLPGNGSGGTNQYIYITEIAQ